MAVYFFQWDDPSDPDGNVQHCADHGLSEDEVESAFQDIEKRGTSRSSGRPMIAGYTSADEYIVVVYEELGNDTYYVVTAYKVED